MKKVHILAAVAMAASLASCQKQTGDDMALNQDASRVPVKFSAVDAAALELTTKADTPSEVALASFKSFNVYTSGIDGLSNVAFSTSASTVTTSTEFNSTSTYYYPKSGSVTFYASNASSVTGTTVTLNSIGKDIVYASGSGSAASTSGVALTFNHAYSQIGTCNITGSNTTGGTVTVNSVKITPKTGGTLNLGTGAWTSTSNGTETPLTNNGTSDNNLWLIPGEYTITVAYTIVQGAYNNTGTATGTVNLAAGKNNNISGSFSITETGITAVKFTVNVTAWANASVSVTF